jgi:hypothetical protein
MDALLVCLTLRWTLSIARFSDRCLGSLGFPCPRSPTRASSVARQGCPQWHCIRVESAVPARFGVCLNPLTETLNLDIENPANERYLCLTE